MKRILTVEINTTTYKKTLEAFTYGLIQEKQSSDERISKLLEGTVIQLGRLSGLAMIGKSKKERVAIRVRLMIELSKAMDHGEESAVFNDFMKDLEEG